MLQPGDLLLERYRIEALLGEGAFGRVYQAHDLRLQAGAAVKELINPADRAGQQFEREAQLLARLRHRNLPRVSNYFVIEAAQYLVMDFIPGEDLKTRLARLGPAEEEEVLRWAVQLCDALMYLHSQTPPVIHRDIKPANIRLDPEGQAVLVDFGIAREVSATGPTTRVYTPGYAAPEQHTGYADSRSDQYALAATLYKLLTDQLPEEGNDRLMQGLPLTSPAQWRTDLSPAVSAAICHALEPRADRRFASVAEFKAALLGETAVAPAPGKPAFLLVPSRHVQPGAEATLLRPDSGRRPDRPAGQQRWPWAAAAAAAALVIVSGFALLPHPPARGGPASTSTAIVPTTVTSAPMVTATRTTTATPVVATMTAPAVMATPDGGGGLIAFLSDEGGPGYQVFVMRPDGSGRRQITFDATLKWSAQWKLGQLQYPVTGNLLAWDSTGAWLAYSAQDPASGAIDIWAVDVQSGAQRNLTRAERADRPNLPDFHPAWCGDTLLFTSVLNEPGRQYPQLFMLTLADGLIRNFSYSHAGGPVEFDAAWLPDCQRLLLVSTQNGRPELWRIFPWRDVLDQLWAVFPSTTQQGYGLYWSELTQDVTTSDPAVSPDGQWLAFMRQSARDRYIAVAAITSKGGQTLAPVNLTQPLWPDMDHSPSWSPDSRWLVYEALRGGQAQVYRIQLNGGGQANVSRNAYNDRSPIWGGIRLP